MLNFLSFDVSIYDVVTERLWVALFILALEGPVFILILMTSSPDLDFVEVSCTLVKVLDQ